MPTLCLGLLGLSGGINDVTQYIRCIEWEAPVIARIRENKRMWHTSDSLNSYSRSPIESLRGNFIEKRRGSFVKIDLALAPQKSQKYRSKCLDIIANSLPTA